MSFKEEKNRKIENIEKEENENEEEEIRIEEKKYYLGLLFLVFQF